MKQKMMLAAIAAVISVGGFAGFNAYQNESLTVLNAEALAIDPEEIETKQCYGGPKECDRVAPKPNEVHIYYFVGND